MKTRLSTLLLLFLLPAYVAIGQVDELKAINEEVWYPFCKAFETFDAELFASVHSETMTRVTGDNNGLKTYENYIEGYRRSFAYQRENGISLHIQLRFFERTVAEGRAVDRGIYQTTYNKGKENERASYGQFFVLLQKEQDRWKIILDYDSSEGGTIGEKQFLEAHAIDDLSPFKRLQE
jgi:hypothetical protein